MKYKPYEVYKDSGIEWIGEIPEGWQIKKLKYVVETKITDGPHTTPQILNDGIPFVSAEAAKENRIDLNQIRGYISEDDHKEFCKKCKPQKEDIFMVKSGATTGAISFVDIDDEFSIWSPLALVRSKKNKYKQRYIFYSMLSDLYKKQVEISWSYGTQQNIGMGIIENLMIFAPPLPEQIVMADYLDTETAKIASIISAKQKLIEKLQEKRSSIISHAVTKGLDPTAKMKPSGVEWIGDIPERWDVSRLNRVFVIKAGGDLKEHLFSEVQDDLHCHPIYTNTVKSNIVYGYTQTAFFKGNTITVTGRGDVGFAVYRDKPYDAIIRLLVLIPKNNWYCKYFAYFINSVLDFSVGSSAIDQLSTKQIAPSIVCIPPELEQTAIADYLDTETAKIDNIIARTKNSIEKLNEYKTALISACVTGKIDVRGQRNVKSN